MHTQRTIRSLTYIIVSYLLLLSANAVSAPPITVHVEGLGSVSSIPSGISCPTDCKEKFIAGTDVQFTAEPAENFLYWGGDCQGTNLDCFLTVSGKVQVFAYFEEAPPSPPYPAPIAKTGKTKCYDIDWVEIDCSGTEQDGEYQAGVAWPSPRLTDNGDGTITDNLTGLVFLANLSCLGRTTWYEAVQRIQDFNAGLLTCSGYTNTHTDWRIPNVNELFSIIDHGNFSPALPDATAPNFPFYPLYNAYGTYWTSTTRNYPNTGSVYTVGLDTGGVSSGNMEVWTNWIWAVRGPDPQ